MSHVTDNMRDEIAFEVMKILLESAAMRGLVQSGALIAAAAYEMADAMCAERERWS